ncbi:uncharacterized protein LAESUDRAFT_194914 [Laetiporus sulphureus 93-53]|uniref:Uncharacterized protein n=1 Tax=Laetiporus sulphureus 93-53 TaxID=1314785 RepID=A0A165E105_9APHY|nr:uncharacterized protein LAESUDRAFT_194914 [Laetiporus sulphureus 93-53]KZT06041.1 hypothetical protein LAESUDRAFT_194914 [Laetiporus sulphureus 93-53]
MPVLVELNCISDWVDDKPIVCCTWPECGNSILLRLAEPSGLCNSPFIISAPRELLLFDIGKLRRILLTANRVSEPLELRVVDIPKICAVIFAPSDMESFMWLGHEDGEEQQLLYCQSMRAFILSLLRRSHDEMTSSTRVCRYFLIRTTSLFAFRSRESPYQR